MREIFKPEPGEPADPGRVFYTITAEDVGKIRISTEIGPIHVRDVMGRVTEDDVGRRLHRVPGPAGVWFWQAENDAQRDARLAKTPAQGGLNPSEPGPLDPGAGRTRATLTKFERAMIPPRGVLTGTSDRSERQQED
jgi:hypothetical protein